jgi:hypothetical protein
MTRDEKRERMFPGREKRAGERREAKRLRELAELRRLKEKYPDER